MLVTRRLRWIQPGGNSGRSSGSTGPSTKKKKKGQRLLSVHLGHRKFLISASRPGAAAAAHAHAAKTGPEAAAERQTLVLLADRLTHQLFYVALIPFVILQSVLLFHGLMVYPKRASALGGSHTSVCMGQCAETLGTCQWNQS